MSLFDDFGFFSLADDEILIFGKESTPKVGEIIETEDGKTVKITRSLGGPNFMSFGVLHEPARVELPGCIQHLYQNGETAGVYDSGKFGGAKGFEKIIRQIALDSGKDVDWHFVGGRAVVRVMANDLPHVRPWLAKLGNNGLN